MPVSGVERYPITFENESVLIGTASELAIALDVLQGQHDHAALQQLAPHLAQITAHAPGLMLLMRSLSTTDKIFLVQAIGPELANVIGSAARLRDLLATLADAEVEEALLTTLGPAGLRQIITNGTELAEVLEWVYGERDALLLDLLGLDSIRHLCRHATELGAVLRTIDFAQQARLLEQLGWPAVVALVQNGRDLAVLLRALPPEHSARLLAHFSGPRLADLIGNASEWTYLADRLEPDELNLLVEKIRGK